MGLRLLLRLFAPKGYLRGSYMCVIRVVRSVCTEDSLRGFVKAEQEVPLHART